MGRAYSLAGAYFSQGPKQDPVDRQMGTEGPGHRLNCYDWPESALGRWRRGFKEGAHRRLERSAGGIPLSQFFFVLFDGKQFQD